MPNTQIKKRLDNLEAANLPSEVGVMWLCGRDRNARRENFVRVGDVKMSLKKFEKMYPGGILIRVVREEKKPFSPDA